MSTGDALPEQGPLRRVDRVAVPRAAHRAELAFGLGAARRRVVLAAGRKLGVDELALVCQIDHVDTLSTDAFADVGVVAGIRAIDADVTDVAVPAG